MPESEGKESSSSESARSSGCSSSSSMDDIPLDIRHLKDFPTYDSTFQDSPRFRQHLNHWASKTDKLAGMLDGLANAFSEFHQTGQQHSKAGNAVLTGLQKLSGLFEGTSNTLAEPLNQFVEELNRMWCYYEAFLGQTELIAVDPVRRFAKSFSTLKGVYEELQQYRKEYQAAAEQMCACRHVTKLTDPQHFQQLAETCYNAEKTYKLVLSKYVVCLREAHTQDMMSIMRRVLEHILSIYSYHNFCTQVMKDMEPCVNNLFTKTKEWKEFYVEELGDWRQMESSVKDHICTDYQQQLENLRKPDTGHGRLSSQMFKPIKRILPLHSPVNTHKTLNRYDSEPLVTNTSRTSSPSTPSESDLDSKSLNFGLPANSSSEQSQLRKRPLKKQLVFMRTRSDADKLEAEEEEEEEDRDSEIYRLSKSADDLTLSGEEGASSKEEASPKEAGSPGEEVEASLETASRKIEAILTNSVAKTKTTGFAGFVAGLRKSGRKIKHRHHRRIRVHSDGHRSRSGSTTPIEAQSPNDTPQDSPRRKKKSVQKGRESLLFFSQEKDDMVNHSAKLPEEKRENIPCRQMSADCLTTSASKYDPYLEIRSNSAQPPSSPGFRSHCQSTAAVITHHPRAVPLSPRVEKTKPILVIDAPPTWIKSGYLELRMKLPNNRYAWTRIYCVIDRKCGQLMIQEQTLPEPRPLEELLLCTVKAGTPDFIDRNFCFRVISPTSEHLFQALSESEVHLWMSAIQEGIGEALKQADLSPQLNSKKKVNQSLQETAVGEIVHDAMKKVIAVPGNKRCADCSSTDVQWASINLGITLCIECSGIHRGLGVHVSKVRSLNLDKWDRGMVEFMQSQGNTKSNVYYEAKLGSGSHSDVRKPHAHAIKSERLQFIQLKYVALAFIPSPNS